MQEDAGMAKMAYYLSPPAAAIFAGFHDYYAGHYWLVSGSGIIATPHGVPHFSAHMTSKCTSLSRPLFRRASRVFTFSRPKEYCHETCQYIAAIFFKHARFAACPGRARAVALAASELPRACCLIFGERLDDCARIDALERRLPHAGS